MRFDERPSGLIREIGTEDMGACESILRSLPDWFGIEEYTQSYVRKIAELQTMGVFLENRCVGFSSIEFHNQFTAEIHVMGIDPLYHGNGYGKRLVMNLCDIAVANGCEFLMVKTLGPSSKDEPYSRTRKFYENCGFRPLQEIIGLWRENPCLLMVKNLSAK